MVIDDKLLEKKTVRDIDLSLEEQDKSNEGHEKHSERTEDAATPQGCKECFHVHEETVCK